MTTDGNSQAKLKVCTPAKAAHPQFKQIAKKRYEFSAWRETERVGKKLKIEMLPGCSIHKIPWAVCGTRTRPDTPVVAGDGVVLIFQATAKKRIRLKIDAGYYAQGHDYQFCLDFCPDDLSALGTLFKDVSKHASELTLAPKNPKLRRLDEDDDTLSSSRINKAIYLQTARELRHAR
jgi:hypothetical protein